MERFDKVRALDKLLRNRRTVIPRQQLQEKLKLSRATTTRLIKFCRTQLKMPIEFDRERQGYFYTEAEKDTFQLPGLWFNRSELLALLTSHRLLADVQPGVLQHWIDPLQTRIEELLTDKHIGSKDIFNRIRIVPMAHRIPHLEDFQHVADALVQRRQLRMVYSSRSNDSIEERQVSPQRLVYYRDNWYLDAWCHLRDALRTFSLDHMRVVETSGKALDIADAELDAHVRGSYGIFAGAAMQKAVIHFSATAARWVADEQWHPQQQSNHLGDGRWELVIPYGNPTELIRDVLRYGPEAEVISPPELRKQVEEQLSAALVKYRRASDLIEAGKDRQRE